MHPTDQMSLKVEQICVIITISSSSSSSSSSVVVVVVADRISSPDPQKHCAAFATGKPVQMRKKIACNPQSMRKGSNAP